MSFKSGFVTIIGRPNVGKSTLLNSIAGEKIAIISDKPQTTRNTIRAVITSEDCQIIFIDTPGLHKPKNKLDEYMIKAARDTINDVDAVLYVVEATDLQPKPGNLEIISQLKNINTNVFLLINKIDLVKKEQLLSEILIYKELMDFKAIIPISAIDNNGVDIVISEIKKILPEGPRYYSEDMITDQPEKIIVAELIREKILNLLREEIPHGIGVDVISFKERDGKDIIDIQAVIFCEKESHKGIIIGKKGEMLKKVGSLSRVDIEKFLGTKVFLELWVKIRNNWRNDEKMIRNLGFE